MLEPTEFPVCVQGRDTRIDILLRHKPSFTSLIVGECKRTHPDYSEWCFCRSRRPGPGSLNFYYAQSALQNPQYPEIFSAPVSPLLSLGDDAYHLGFEVPGPKQDAPKDILTPKILNQIEGACGQVCHGVSGLLNAFKQFRDLLQRRELTTLFPVIFTTARLWTSDIDLAGADLATGYPQLATSLRRVKWVHFQYPMSPGLMHDVPLGKKPENLVEYATSTSLRTIMIVHAADAKEFFQWFNPSHWLGR